MTVRTGHGVVTYPRPWVVQHRIIRVLATFCGVVGVFCLFLGIAARDLGVILFGVGIAAGVTVLPLVAGWRRASRLGARDESLRNGAKALVVGVPWWRLTGVVIAIVLMWVLYVYIALNQDVAREVARSSRYELLATAAVELAPLTVVLLPVLALAFFLGKRKILGVGLGVDGVYHWWWGGCSFYPWERMSGVWLVRPQAGPRVELRMRDQAVEANPEENWLGRMVWMRQRHRKIQLGLFRVHPGVTYQALCFYLRHPELREELNDGRALERMRAGDYGEIIDEIRRHGRALNPGE